MQPQLEYANRQIEIAHVLSVARSIWCRHFGIFSLVMIVVAFPNFSTLLLVAVHVLPAGLYEFFLALFVAFLTFPLGFAVLSICVQSDKNGQAVLLWPAIKQAVRLAPYLSACYLWLVPLLLGKWMFFLEKAFGAIVVWPIAAQACAVEGLGPMQSYARAVDLAKDQKLRILRLNVIIIMSSFVFDIFRSFLWQNFGVPGALISMITNGMGGAYFGTVYAVLFHQLRGTS